MSNVKGSWKVPSLSCSKSTSYAAFWDGIDRLSDGTVEQTGVLAECYQGKVYYYTWYEFYPSLPVYDTGQVPEKAGDVVYAEVSYASGTFIATITDQTTAATFTTSQTDSNAQRSSAEWITEAPSSGEVLPLAYFGTGYFGSDYTNIASTSYATVNGVTSALGSFGSSVYELVMVTMNLTVKAQPSVLTRDGSSFSVTWKHSNVRRSFRLSFRTTTLHSVANNVPYERYRATRKVEPLKQRFFRRMPLTNVSKTGREL